MSRSARLLTATLAAITVLAGTATSRVAAAVTSTPLTSRGALLQASHATQVRLVEVGAMCTALLTSGDGQCGVVHASGGDVLYTVEAGPPAPPGPTARPWTVTIYRSVRAVAGGWRAALQTRPTAGRPEARFATVTARIAHLTPDGYESLVVGYRSEGTGAFLDVDIVVGGANGPRVAAHTRLDQGVVTIHPGQLTTYTPSYRPGDPNCCASSVQRDAIQQRHGSFGVVPGPRLAARVADKPPSDLA